MHINKRIRIFVPMYHAHVYSKLPITTTINALRPLVRIGEWYLKPAREEIKEPPQP